MKNRKYTFEWLKRSESKLVRARLGKIREEILYEDLCFDCQQSVEKVLKALLINMDKQFPPIHSIARLLELITEEGIEIPEAIKKAIILTDYAVKTRYPGELEPVKKEEYEEALVISENVFRWVFKMIGGKK